MLWLAWHLSIGSSKMKASDLHFIPWAKCPSTQNPRLWGMVTVKACLLREAVPLQRRKDRITNHTR